MFDIRTNHNLRLKVFDLLVKLKEAHIERAVIIKKLHKKFGIPVCALYTWFSGKRLPCGRKGDVFFEPELFYVLGALLGDGCIYNWKTTRNYVILVGDKKFAKKYAKLVTKCTGIKVKAYIDRSHNVWFVRTNNYRLFSLFKETREDPTRLEQLLKENGKRSSLLFIEGFFDAEGCVKIVKEKVRKVAKICLDITNTNFAFLEVVRKQLKDFLNVEAKYSVQKSSLGKDGYRRKKAFHLRIYKKESVKVFFENIRTTKLKGRKVTYLKNWLTNGK